MTKCNVSTVKILCHLAKRIVPTSGRGNSELGLCKGEFISFKLSSVLVVMSQVSLSDLNFAIPQDMTNQLHHFVSIFLSWLLRSICDMNYQSMHASIWNPQWNFISWQKSSDAVCMSFTSHKPHTVHWTATKVKCYPTRPPTHYGMSGKPPLPPVWLWKEWM